MTQKLRFQDYVDIGSSGTKADVDLLMGLLVKKADLLGLKLVDNALTLIRTAEGRNQIQYYLFHGTYIQRNYAALYFKRRSFMDIVHKAYGKGLLDDDQAFSK